VPIPTRLLVLGMAHEDGTILAAEVYPVAEACAQSPEQVRSCFRRLEAEGLFTRDGAGRTAVYRATEHGLSAVGSNVERTRLAYGQDAAGRTWDRHWHLVAFGVPEARRSARDTLRDRLLALGGAAVQGGLYVSPHPWEKDVRACAEQLDLVGEITTASTDDLDIAGEHDPREIARRLWPIDDLAERYTALCDEYSPVIDLLEDMRSRHEKMPDTTFLPGALGMAVTFMDCFGDDPLLPPDLLPRPWPGRAARQLILNCRRLALGMRQTPGRPALFRVWDDALQALT
jgi:phenylacetic acid degradation operon negative regulatory protein